MKKIIAGILLSTLMLSGVAFAEYVNGYYKSNGTYVQGYYRSNANNTVQDNYSYYGNTNPYTLKKGTNKYKSNKTSSYYNTNNVYDYNYYSY